MIGCIKVAKKGHPAAARLAEQTRGWGWWSGGHGFEFRLIFGFFFLPLSKHFLSFLAG